MFEDIQFFIKRHSGNFMTMGWKFKYKDDIYSNYIDNRLEGTTKIEYRKYFEEDGEMIELPIEVFDLYGEVIPLEKQIGLVKNMVKTMEDIIERERAINNTQRGKYGNRKN